MTDLTLADIMTREVYLLRADTPVQVALRSLTARHIGGAPVLGGDGKPCGVISTWDLIDANNGPRANDTVGEVMTPHVISMPPTTSIYACAALMAHDDIHRVVVIDEDGDLVGIVTSMDLVRAIARMKP